MCCWRTEGQKSVFVCFLLFNDSKFGINYHMAYFFRSKIETLFPTGLITALPSLEKLRFP